MHCPCRVPRSKPLSGPEAVTIHAKPITGILARRLMWDEVAIPLPRASHSMTAVQVHTIAGYGIFVFMPTTTDLCYEKGLRMTFPPAFRISYTSLEAGTTLKCMSRLRLVAVGYGKMLSGLSTWLKA